MARGMSETTAADRHHSTTMADRARGTSTPLQEFNENRGIAQRFDLDASGSRRGSNRLLAAVAAQDDKCLLSYSDNEMESFRSFDLHTTTTSIAAHSDASHDAAAFKSSSSSGSVHRKKSDTVSLKSQKSTESIGSFFNSILTHPNTGKSAATLLEIYFHR